MPSLPSSTEPIEGLPQYGYDPANDVYYNLATGNIVSWDEIKQQLESISASLKDKVIATSALLRDGAITLAEWQTEMMASIKQSHIIAAVIAAGGFLLMSQLLYRRVEEQLADEYEMLTNFAKQVETGQQRMDGTLARRAALYIAAMIPFYYAISDFINRQKGYDEERSILTPADHCTNGDGSRGGCVEEARKGWRPIGTIIPIGQRNCYGNCRCRKEYRNSKTGQVTSR